MVMMGAITPVIKGQDAGSAASGGIAPTTLTDLAFALQYVSPLAAEVGLSIQDVSSALGVLANVGIIGRRLGTFATRTCTFLSSM